MLIREMTEYALDATARAERDGYHSRRASTRLEADARVLRRRVAELELDLAGAEERMRTCQQEMLVSRQV